MAEDNQRTASPDSQADGAFKDTFRLLFFRELARVLRARLRPTEAPPPSHESPVPGHGDDSCAAIESELRSVLPARHNAVGGHRDVDLPVVSGKGTTEEPRVEKLSVDLTGLCLSGGGIRSATFNLGVMQALHRLDLLSKFDYVSTVSGGGYLGGFWSRWMLEKRRHPPAPAPASPRPFADEDELFPSSDPNAPQIRHLREFSRFLSPRVGVIESETGNFVIAIVAALVPALFATAALVVATLLVYAGLAHLLSLPVSSPIALTFQADAYAGLVGFSVVTYVALLLLEGLWQRSGSAAAIDQRRLLAGAVAPAATLMATAALAGLALLESHSIAAALGLHRAAAALPASAYRWEAHAPSLAWLMSAAVGVMLRLMVARRIGLRSHRGRSRRNALDRVTSRLLLFALLWSGVAIAWQTGIWLAKIESGAVLGAAQHAAVVASSSGAFAWVTHLFVRSAPKTKSPGLWDRIRPLIPQLLAYLTVFAIVAAAARFVAWSVASGHLVVLIASAGAILLAVLYFFDPREVGLHSAYRTRIARAYLGASRARGADPSRETDELEQDDAPLSDLPDRPLHLVCCAANDLAGDPLPNLNRGARSAVLSRAGVSIGDSWRDWRRYQDRSPDLASALTASAAAFNSNMGSRSVELGPVVTFLMTALNLRLGLWLQHPRHSENVERWPGRLFFLEMFGRTHANRAHAWLHLSDGGHFENLGLYELVRRHCRYILVCDSGQDPDCEFDDLGNALRRVRQDFGADINLDLSGLRPDANGRSRRHVAVGDIRYCDGDKGVLVYIKPSLVGEEPGDVQQYRTRNPDFPHETTGDQFYDNAQWESYRRLGVHIVERVFRCVDRIPGERPPARIFNELYWQWYPTPDGFSDDFLELTKRCYEIDDRMRATAPRWFVRELYPELDTVSPLANGVLAPTAEELERVIPLLTEGMQLIEDVWLRGSLDELPNHPLNLGWINYVQRWVYSPTFRAWWPILRPMWSPGVRRFLEERFDLDKVVPPHATVTVRPMDGGAGSGMASRRWRQMDMPRLAADQKAAWFACTIQLEQPGLAPRALEVGLARLELDAPQRGTARWHADDFYVAAGLWGAGTGSSFLRALFSALQEPPYSIGRCEVDISTRADSASKPAAGAIRGDEVVEPNDESSRRERDDLRQFYLAAGFKPSRDNEYVLERALDRPIAVPTPKRASIPPRGKNKLTSPRT